MKKEQRMAQIKAIYEESHEIYGTKIAAKMRQNGDKVSGRTVGKYMRRLGFVHVTGNTEPTQQGIVISAAD